jgi:hypothetical protein
MDGDGIRYGLATSTFTKRTARTARAMVASQSTAVATGGGSVLVSRARGFRTALTIPTDRFG